MKYRKSYMPMLLLMPSAAFISGMWWLLSCRSAYGFSELSMVLKFISLSRLGLQHSPIHCRILEQLSSLGLEHCLSRLEDITCSILPFSAYWVCLLRPATCSLFCQRCSHAVLALQCFWLLAILYLEANRKDHFFFCLLIQHFLNWQIYIASAIYSAPLILP